MRPLFLKIQGLKSISDEQSIDFERVSKNGIFGVFGKTGSGKSTILDAIVLAIYGEVTEKIENSEFVNKGSNQTKVDLLFSVSQNGVTNKYRVERVYKFTGKENKNLSANAKLWKISENGDEFIVAEGASGVTELMKTDIIGLDKKDFLKCIALPQGEFSAFVKMGRAERLKVVGKLFNLEKYGTDLWRKASALENNLKVEEAKLQSKKEELEEYSTENFEKIKKDFKEKGKEFEKIKGEMEKSSKEKERVTAIKNLLNERIEKSAEKDKKLAYRSIIDGYKEEIAQFEKVEKLKDIIINQKRDKENLITKQRENQKLISYKEELLRNLEKAKLNKDKNQERQDEITKLHIELEKINSCEDKQKKLDELTRELTQKRIGYKEFDSQRKHIESEAEKYREEVAKYIELASSLNVEKLLDDLKNNISTMAVKELATSFLSFLDELKKLVEKLELKNGESAVNQLIAREIQQISTYISEEESGDIKALLNVTTDAINKSGEYQRECEKFKGLLTTCEVKLNTLKEKMDVALNEGKKLSEDHKKIEGELNLILKGESFSVATNKVQRQIENLNSEIDDVNKKFDYISGLCHNNDLKITSLQTEISAESQKIDKNQGRIDELLRGENLTFEGAESILQSEKIIIDRKKQVERFESDLKLIEMRLGELNEKLKNETLTLDEIDKICLKSVEISKAYQEISENYGEIKSYYQIGLKKTEEWCIINKNIMDIYGKQQVIGRLTQLLKEGRFMEFVAEEYLTEIADDGQRRLLELTGGVYGLKYSGGNFFVTDNLRGGIIRPVASLSGGETFLVSLSLALALSSQISLKALKPIDFFFLDEGFGTLDDELIETVTDSLEKLQKANLTVGLITHVGELKNRIQSKIMVTGATAIHGTIIDCNC